MFVHLQFFTLVDNGCIFQVKSEIDQIKILIIHVMIMFMINVLEGVMFILPNNFIFVIK